jgi:hypothetical protein
LGGPVNRSEISAIDFAPVANRDNNDNYPFIFEAANEADIAYPKPPQLDF